MRRNSYFLIMTRIQLFQNNIKTKLVCSLLIVYGLPNLSSVVSGKFWATSPVMIDNQKGKHTKGWLGRILTLFKSLDGSVNPIRSGFKNVLVHLLEIYIFVHNFYFPIFFHILESLNLILLVGCSKSHLLVNILSCYVMCIHIRYSLYIGQSHWSFLVIVFRRSPKT